MKKIISLAIVFCTLLVSNETSAQVAIGKESVSNSSVLLEFDPGAKGLIVPQVASAPSPANGTFIFNSTAKVFQVYENGAWKNLTDADAGVVHSYTNSGTDVITEPNGAVIGSSSSTKRGALVLESGTQALVLPQVANPHSTMKGSIAGTMVYDTASDTLAVYDGANWSYWK